MTVLFAGGECEAFVVSNAANVSEVTTGGTYDSTYSRCSIELRGGSEWMESAVFAAQTTIWAHIEHYSGNTTGQSGLTVATLYNSSGTAVFRLQYTSTGVVQPQYWNGSAWTNIGTTISVSVSTRYIYDLKVVCGASGSFELYVGGTLQSSGSASMTSVNDIAKVRCHSGTTSASNRHCFSQIIVATTSTVGWKYYLKPPTGNGANTAFTNDYTAVDETTLSDADYITSGVANDVETFTGAALSLGSFIVKAVVVSMRAKNDGVAPVNVQAALRRGSTNYFSSNLSINSGFGPALGIFETDPSTGVAWTASDAGSSATEFGAKSIT